ncbi:uncharacterized protein ACOB8E_010644 isoform 1-T1 [Sarcophilus harrisii]
MARVSFFSIFFWEKKKEDDTAFLLLMEEIQRRQYERTKPALRKPLLSVEKANIPLLLSKSLRVVDYNGMCPKFLVPNTQYWAFLHGGVCQWTTGISSQMISVLKWFGKNDDKHKEKEQEKKKMKVKKRLFRVRGQLQRKRRGAAFSPQGFK